MNIETQRRMSENAGFNSQLGLGRTDEPGTNESTDPNAALQTKLLRQARQFLDANDRTNRALIQSTRETLVLLEGEYRIAFGERIVPEVEEQMRHLRETIAALDLQDTVPGSITGLDQRAQSALNTSELQSVAQQTREIRDRIREQVEAMMEGTEAREIAMQQLELVEQFLGQIGEEIAAQLRAEKEKVDLTDRWKAALTDAKREYKGIGDQARKSSGDLIEVATSINRAVRGAIDLGEAFGFVSRETARALDNIGQIAEGVAAFAGGDKVGGSLAVLGGIGQLFKGDRERERILQENTAAIERLKRSFDEASSRIFATVPGSQIAGVEGAVARILGNPDAFRFQAGAIGTNNVDPDAWMRLGVSMEEVREVAETLDISFKDKLSPTFQELEQLGNALADIEFDKLLNSFAGSLRLLRAEIDLFDIDDPIEQFRSIRKEFLRFAELGFFREVPLGAIDPSTPAGRAALEAAIQRLFEDLQAGRITKARLGRLTYDEFLQALLDMERLLDQANAANAGTTQSFAVTRSITEVTGSRIASLLTTHVVHLENIDRNIAQILSQMTRAVPGVRPPLLPEDSLSPPQDQNVQIANITINVGAGADSQAVSAAVQDGVAKAIDEALGRRLRRKRTFSGDPLRN